MIARQRDVPRQMKGGDPDNPLGTRAMYLQYALPDLRLERSGFGRRGGIIRLFPDEERRHRRSLYRVPVGTTVVVQ